MSVIESDTLSNENLRKKVAALFSLEDWAHERGICSCPSLLHKDGPCTRKEKEYLEVVIMIWSEYKRRVKPFLSTFKSDYRKEAKQSVLLDSLNQWVTQIYGKNTDNMNKYTENMTKLVT